MLNAFIALLLAFASGAPTLDWSSWGGPNGNFAVDGQGLPASFGQGIPKVLWQRSLGDGFSSIVTDGALLYTMYRRGNEEVVVAIDPATGDTRWEYGYDATFQPGMVVAGYHQEMGTGPYATPLIFDDHVYTIGVLGTMHAFDKKTGKVVWRKDLFKHFPANPSMVHGFAVSPIACKNTIIVKPGEQGHAIMALNPNDGSLVWERQNFTYTPSTPILINVDGQEQLVATFSGVVVGFDPDNGELLWSQPPQGVKLDQARSKIPGYIISTPIWGPGNLLFTSSAGGGGASVLHLTQSAGKTKVEELWYSNLMRVHYSNALRIGDYVYGSSGDSGPSPLTAINLRTGQVAWRDRTFGKANMVLAGEKVILLDEGGNLARVTLTPEGMNVRWNVQLLQGVAWTSSTLVGTKLYLRDRRTIMALDLR
jgi:outer membrane protein assembly factor BamB